MRGTQGPGMVRKLRSGFLEACFHASNPSARRAAAASKIGCMGWLACHP
jgi:hypothetical protein